MIGQIAVVVPAADEEDEIEGCLDALLVAANTVAEKHTVATRIVVVLDRCRDRTGDIVAGFPEVVAVRSTARCVGTARRQGVDAALDLLGAEGTWVASSDADCRVPADWLTGMLALARAGARLVLGTVRPQPGLRPDVEAAWMAGHQLHDGHPHVHAANLGIAAESYAAVGGWRDLHAHEDVDLVRRAEFAGVPIVRTGALPVRASRRLIGRTPRGFAGYLRQLTDDLPAVG